jgi:hypothetical protein
MAAAMLRKRAFSARKTESPNPSRPSRNRARMRFMHFLASWISAAGFWHAVIWARARWICSAAMRRKPFSIGSSSFSRNAMEGLPNLVHRALRAPGFFFIARLPRFGILQS